MSTQINHFAISAILGTTIGPRVSFGHGQIGSVVLPRALERLRAEEREVHRLIQTRESQSKQYFRLLIRAFQETRNGYSPDRVIADPNLNRRFVAECHRIGLKDSTFHLNLSLLMMRKSSALRGFPTSKPTKIAEQWRFSSASEHAARMIYFQYQLSVDSLLCHPEIVTQFDHLATELVPGHSALDYRWAALNSRKRGGGAKDEEEIDQDDAFVWSSATTFDSDLRLIPEEPAVFGVEENEQYLYVAETKKLRSSFDVQRHLVESAAIDRKLWTPNPSTLRLVYTTLPKTREVERAKIVNRLIGSLHPVFNIPRAA